MLSIDKQHLLTSPERYLTSMSSSDEMITVFTQIPQSEMPLPGSWIEAKLSNGMTAQIWNLRKGESLERRPQSLGFVPVKVASGSATTANVHAAISRRLRGRNNPERYALCDSAGLRPVESVVHGSLDDEVTCGRCRHQLVQEGVLDS